MTTLLRIESSARRHDSDSRDLANRYVAAWLRCHPQGRVVTRDLGAEPVGHLDEATLLALAMPASQRDASARRLAVYADALVEEFLAADEIVVGVPMYNLGIPSTLKAYLDHIARAGKTFRYTPAGPEGLVGGRHVTLLLTRGGLHGDNPLDQQASYLRSFFGFLGIDAIDEVVAEGLNIDPAVREAALAAAIEKLTNLEHAA